MRNTIFKDFIRSRFISHPLYILLPFAFCLLPFAFKVLAHEPITTKVRFNKEVIRVFERSCLGCHRPNGITPMSLATYEEARPWAKAIKEEMLERRMPVWHAVKGYGEFRNAPLLTQREIDLIVNWVEGGAPKGDDKDYPQKALFSNNWTLGKPDMVLPLPEEQKVASDTDETRTFKVAINSSQDRWLRAIDLRPINHAVILSATIYLENKPSKAAPDSRLQTPDSRLVLATWMPGQQAVALPEGTARILPANSNLVVKIHYRSNGEESKDRSEIGLYFTPNKPPRQLREVVLTDATVTIPANAAAHPLKLSHTVQDEAEAVAIRPYAHPLIISFQASVYLPDGSERVLIWTRGSKYDWQPTYYFKHPVTLPKGTRIEVTAYFDNSENNAANPHDPPKELRWADISQDPLCTLQVSTNRGTTD